jgi:voltage-gated potassium channel
MNKLPRAARSNGIELWRGIKHGWSFGIVRAAALLVALAAIGTVGYMLIEGWPFGDALFMAIGILSTVGLETPRPLTAGGRAFTIALIVTGVSVAAYLVSRLGEYVTGGVLTGMFRERRVGRAIARLSDHYIVCGYGRVGRQVADDLFRRGYAVVIIERDITTQSGSGALPMIAGDATADEVLIRAGVRRARGLVAGTGADPANTVIALSARALNPSIVIVARASDPASEANLGRAGATYVVSPYAIGGRRIVSELLDPGVATLFDIGMSPEQSDLWLEVATLAPASPFVGETLSHALQVSRGTVNLVALRPASRTDFITNPSPDVRLTAGDTLVALGPHPAVHSIGVRAMGADAHTVELTPRTSMKAPAPVG